jgi:hypothetical protein
LESKVKLLMVAPGWGCLYGGHYSAICMHRKKNLNRAWQPVNDSFLLFLI